MAEPQVTYAPKPLSSWDDVSDGRKTIVFIRAAWLGSWRSLNPEVSRASTALDHQRVQIAKYDFSGSAIFKTRAETGRSAVTDRIAAFYASTHHMAQPVRKSLLILNENENMNRSEDGAQVALIGEVNFDQRSPIWKGEL